MAHFKLIGRLRRAVEERAKAMTPMLNRIRPPGMKGSGLFDVLTFLWKSLNTPRFTLAAMAMSYRFFFALFPAMILLFTLIPYIPVKNLKEEVLVFLASIVPADSLGFVYHIVDEFFNRPSAGVIYLNIALMLLSAMGGIKVMMQAFSKEHAFFRQRGFLRANLDAFIIFMTLLVVFAVTLALLITGEILIKDLQQRDVINRDGVAVFFLRIGYYLVLLFALQVTVSIIYYFGPPLHKRWKFFSAGSVIGGVLILLAITAFQLFFVNFTDYNKIYGSLGAIMIMMVWFYWISIVLLIGFELNTAIDRAHDKGTRIEVPPPPITPTL